MTALDLIDRKIVAQLMRDATQSVAQIADQVGLSSTPCWKRIRRLESDGVIERRVALARPQALGWGSVRSSSCAPPITARNGASGLAPSSLPSLKSWRSGASQGKTIICCASP